MPSIQPITDAVYGKRSSARKKPAKPSRKPRAGTLVGQLVGPEFEAELYRRLGLKPKRRG